MAHLADSEKDDLANPEKPVSNDSLPTPGQAGKAGRAATPIDAVSLSLRQAYESTLQEDIPDAFMDLLNKLG